MIAFHLMIRAVFPIYLGDYFVCPASPASPGDYFVCPASPSCSRISVLVCPASPSRSYFVCPASPCPASPPVPLSPPVDKRTLVDWPIWAPPSVCNSSSIVAQLQSALSENFAITLRQNKKLALSSRLYRIGHAP